VVDLFVLFRYSLGIGCRVYLKSTLQGPLVYPAVHPDHRASDTEEEEIALLSD